MLSLLVALSATGALGCSGKAVLDEGQAGGNGSGGGGSAPALVVSVLDLVAYADCMPAVPPDPLSVELTLHLDNTAGSAAATAELTAAALDGDAGHTSFSLTPASSGSVAAGATKDIDVHKLPSSGFGTPGCSWCGASKVTFELEVDVAGHPQQVSEPTSVGCAY